MNTTEMTFDPSLRARLPALPATTLDEVLAGLAAKPSERQGAR
jgi:hypothetical protein